VGNNLNYRYGNINENIWGLPEKQDAEGPGYQLPPDNSVKIKLTPKGYKKDRKRGAANNEN
jgi:hypothetical protein